MAAFNFYTAVLVGGLSVYFIKLMQNNYGKSFSVPVSNLTVITWTIISALCYSGCLLMIDKYIHSTTCRITLWNVNYLVGEILPLTVIMVIHNTTISDDRT